MKQYLTFGPVRLRLHSRHLASWGYPRLQIGGLAVGSRSNIGDIILASYHPKSSITWLWSVALGRNKTPRKNIVNLDTRRFGQWHDYIRLPFAWELRISHQKRMTRRPYCPGEQS